MIKHLDETQKIGTVGLVRQNKAGTVTKVRLATNAPKTAPTHWHNLLFTGKLAAVARQWLKPGDTLYIRGDHTYGSYVKDGITHETTAIFVNDMNILSSPKESAEIPQDTTAEFLAEEEEFGSEIVEEQESE